MIRIASLVAALCLMAAPLPASTLSATTSLNREEMPVDLTTGESLDISVVEFVITDAIEGREPVKTPLEMTATPDRLFAFTRIDSKTTHTITHVWYRDDKRVADVPLDIGISSGWRTWSSKAIVPSGPANWRVEVISEGGTLLAETRFTVE